MFYVDFSSPSKSINTRQVRKVCSVKSLMCYSLSIKIQMFVYLKSRIWSFFSSSQFVIILTSMNFYDHFLEAEHPADMHPVSKLSQDQQDQQEIDQTTSNCPNVRHLYRRHNGSGIASQCKKGHFCVHLYLYSSTSVFVRVCNSICPSVQLYLHNMSGTATQWERRDKMNLLTPRSPLTSPDHWKLVILMRNVYLTREWCWLWLYDHNMKKAMIKIMLMMFLYQMCFTEIAFEY